MINNLHEEETEKRFGHTDAYKQSTERVAKMSPRELEKIKDDNHNLHLDIVANMKEGSESPIIQGLIQRHYDGLNAFYTPSLDIYRGLAEMYVADPRFSAFYDKYTPGLATFMHDAIIVFCNQNEKVIS